MLIIQIALGIVLGFLIIAFWPIILGGALVVAGVIVALILAAVLYACTTPYHDAIGGFLGAAIFAAIAALALWQVVKFFRPQVGFPSMDPQSIDRDKKQITGIFPHFYVVLLFGLGIGVGISEHSTAKVRRAAPVTESVRAAAEKDEMEGYVIEDDPEMAGYVLEADPELGGWTFEPQNPVAQPRKLEGGGWPTSAATGTKPADKPRGAVRAEPIDRGKLILIIAVVLAVWASIHALIFSIVRRAESRRLWRVAERAKIEKRREEDARKSAPYSVPPRLAAR